MLVGELPFGATIGVLEGGRPAAHDKPAEEADSFLWAARKAPLVPGFIEPLVAHVRVNASHGHGCVSRQLFGLIPGIGQPTIERLLRKVPLFVETYAQFFNGVLAYYSDPSNPLLRRIPED